jgi:hypothetical protein
MPNSKIPHIQDDLFANDYPIPSNINAEQSSKEAINPQQDNSNRQSETQVFSPEDKDSSLPSSAKLANLLDNQSLIYQLTNNTDWQKIKQELGENYQYKKQNYDIRQLSAMYILSKQNLFNHQLALSLWLENPYWQYFCGMNTFQTSIPFDVEVLKSFSIHIQQKAHPYLDEISEKLAKPSHKKPLTDNLKNLSKAKKLKKVKLKSSPILQPVSIHWYQDYLFYVYFLVAISFWVIYSLIYPTNWPREMLTLNQWKSFLYIVIGYPIVEEIIFRGGAQTWLRRYSWARISSLGISVANMSVSLLFSVLHIIIRPDDYTAYGIIIPSLIFGMFKDRHRHIISCTILHIFYNMGIFFLLILPTVK